MRTNAIRLPIQWRMRLLSDSRHFFEQVGALFWLSTDTLLEMASHVFRGKTPVRFRFLLAQSERAGTGSVPLVAMVSAFLGLTMALLTGYELQRFGTQQLVPGLVAISFARELGPLLTGIMLASRLGAAYAAELGTMNVSEEVEAIEAMGVGPLRLLVAPRLLAVFLLMPSLVVVSNIAANLGGAFICRAQLHLSYRFYFEEILRNLLLRDVIEGAFKSLVFGFLIGVIACYNGLNVKGGAAGVGAATTSSVVHAVTSVIGFDALINLFFVRVLS